MQSYVFNVLSYLFAERLAMVYGLNKVKPNHWDEKESRTQWKELEGVECATDLRPDDQRKWAMNLSLLSLQQRQ